jgi:nucleotide-binding universal stress UspA family protein
MVVAQRPDPAVSQGYRNVLVPLIDAPDVERVVNTACTLAHERGSVTAVVVIEISPLLPLDARMDDEEEHARTLLRRAQAAGDGYGMRVGVRMIRAREAGSTILDLAEKMGTDLLVLGTPRHRLRRRIRHVLRKAPCRVLLVV